MLKFLIPFIFFPALAMAEAIPLLPPAEFDHPFAGRTEIYVTHDTNVWHECSVEGLYPTPRNVAGCAWVENGVCKVVVATRSPRATADDIIRHEIAHCNGWEH